MDVRPNNECLPCAWHTVVTSRSRLLDSLLVIHWNCRHEWLIFSSPVSQYRTVFKSLRWVFLAKHTSRYAHYRTTWHTVTVVTSRSFQVALPGAAAGLKSPPWVADSVHIPICCVSAEHSAQFCKVSLATRAHIKLHLVSPVCVRMFLRL